MLEQNISVDKLIEVLQRVKARDGIESITTFELLHILPGDEAAQHLRALDEDECAVCHFEYQPHWESCPNCGAVRPHQ